MHFNYFDFGVNAGEYIESLAGVGEIIYKTYTDIWMFLVEPFMTIGDGYTAIPGFPASQFLEAFLPMDISLLGILITIGIVVILVLKVVKLLPFI